MLDNSTIIADNPDPFSSDNFTRLIHLSSDLSPIEKAAILSRYSRTKKSLTEVIATEFENDKNRAPNFITKLLSEYGDDSIAELASEVIGVEGLSILGSYHLTDQRIGISFIEKSTRYVSLDNSVYIPDKIYEYGLLDEFKDLCGLSYNTFQKIYNELEPTFQEKHPLSQCMFFDSSKGVEVSYENLKSEQDIKNAQAAHKRAIKDKAYDNAGYCWLSAYKTNIGFNSNARALESLINKTKTSNLPELNYLSDNLYNMLARKIEPFIIRTKRVAPVHNNPFETYTGRTSETSVYKHNVATFVRARDGVQDSINKSHEEEEEEEEQREEEEEEEKKQKHQQHPQQQHYITLMKQGDKILGPSKPIQTACVKTILNMLPFKIKYREANIDTLNIEPSDFEPYVKLIGFMDEQTAIDTIATIILYENDEKLLDYDEIEVMNIDPATRILKPNEKHIQQGMLYHLINKHKTVKDIYEDEYPLIKKSENNLELEDIQEYWMDNRSVNNLPLYTDYSNPKSFTLTKDQHFLFDKYIGERKSRRDKLGRAFEMIDYMFEISSSFRILREFKRHRTLSPIYPKVITARDSYQSFIFPMPIIQDRNLFESYKNLIEKSFILYKKIAMDKGDYITAQYCLPLSVRCNYIAKMNLRELDYILSLRTTPQAHPEFRAIAQTIYDLLLTVHPNLSKMLKFVDKNSYPLGRIKSEFNTLKKMDTLSN